VALTVEFADVRGASRQLGPYERLCFEGETFIAEPGGVLVAKHVDHEWHGTSGVVYTRLECNTPVFVHSRRTSIFNRAGSARSTGSPLSTGSHTWYSHPLG
jgi:hypothetical protein